ncbi:hypothetical protein [Chlorogloea sp. CCALA 695]|uniref:hypothetical protein n=1 Tax=Chlorogloea sp. CCALA 695 TaxID=2107693 RepID=UPI000D0513B7|nr:hypothetical protein [Chlorogloea sp. CCALA 695]PSB26291.1 hypothetical protein C7B70_24075 [Chlorogloea sp. CCALA 695]
MKILNSKLLFAGLTVLALHTMLQMQPARSWLTARQSASQLRPFQRVWFGAYRFIGGNSQIQMYIDLAGNLFGSFASARGFRFAQIRQREPSLTINN